MKQGTVTIDINDYDSLLEKSLMVKIDIKKEDNEIVIRFDLLKNYVNKQVKKVYPDFNPKYYNDLALKYVKDSNE